MEQSDKPPILATPARRRRVLVLAALALPVAEPDEMKRESVPTADQLLP